MSIISTTTELQSAKSYLKLPKNNKKHGKDRPRTKIDHGEPCANKPQVLGHDFRLNEKEEGQNSKSKSKSNEQHKLFASKKQQPPKRWVGLHYLATCRWRQCVVNPPLIHCLLQVRGCSTIIMCFM